MDTSIEYSFFVTVDVDFRGERPPQARDEEGFSARSMPIVIDFQTAA